MRTSTVTKNILTAAVAALVFAAFVILGTRGDNSDAQKRLNALETSTTTTIFEEPTSTTSTTAFVDTTTTTFPVTVTTAAPAPTTTVKRSTTATTKKPTTATTRKPSSPTTTTPAPPHNGVGQEVSDNTYSFTLPSGPTSPDPSASPTDPFSFTIKATPTSANNVHFLVVIQNNTSRTISFPNGLRIIVTISQTGSPDQTYALTSSTFTSMAPGERDSITSDGLVLGAGSFTASATCDVDYGS